MSDTIKPVAGSDPVDWQKAGGRGVEAAARQVRANSVTDSKPDCWAYGIDYGRP